MSHYRPKDGKDGLPGTHGKDGRDGVDGQTPEHDWVGTNLRFKAPNGEFGQFVDLEGPPGKDGKDGLDGKDGADGKDGRDGTNGRDGKDGTDGKDGEKGEIGPMPDHQWRDTSLRFQDPDGGWGRYVNLKGEKGDPGTPGSSGGGLSRITASKVEVATLPGATYNNVQEVINVMFSPGIITGGEVTELSPTVVRITGGTAVARVADDNTSELRFFDFVSQDFSVPDIQVTHFYALDYNGGSPVMVESTVTENWDRDTEIPLGSAVRGDGFLNVTPNPYRTGDVITNLIQRLDAVSPVQRDNSVGGLVLGQTGVRNVTVTPGRLWSRVSDFSIASKNSATEPMASLFFNGTNLTVTSGITQWDNQNYNSLGTGTLVPIGNNKWANLWFFMSFDGSHYGFAYGTADYNSLGQAANEGVPSYLTQNFFNQFVLLGRFVFQESAVTPAQIESAFGSLFSTQAVNTHNDLGGLQGGAVGEFYHMTLLQNTDVTNMSTGGTTGQFWRGDKAWSNTLTGNFLVNGNATLGDATSDRVSVPGKMLATDLSGNEMFISTGASPRLQINGVGASAAIVNNQTSFSIARYFNDTGAPNIYIVKSRGSTVNDNSVAVVNADEVGSFRYEASNGTGLSRGAVFQVFVDGVPSGTSVPMRFGFQTMPLGGALTERLNIGASSLIVNDPGADYDFRVEGDTLSHLLFCDASSATENIALCSTIQPNWQTMNRGIFLGNASVVPAGNPTGGGFMYAEAGAGKWRGSGGTITTFGPADPHCPICSSDFVHEWENPKYGYLAVCMNCHCNGINSHTRVKGEWSGH